MDRIRNHKVREVLEIAPTEQTLKDNKLVAGIEQASGAGGGGGGGGTKYDTGREVEEEETQMGLKQGMLLP